MIGPRDLARWARLFGSLPADERRARMGRVADRLLRRSRSLRAVNFAPATPSWPKFEAALEVPLNELTARLAPGEGEHQATVPATVDWHRDPVSGFRWDPTTYFTDVETVRLDGSDVRVPWELARLQHLIPMGRERSPEAAAQVLSFLAENPPGLGVNWASPMEVALRAVSLTAALEFFRGLPGWEAPVVREIVRALWVHGRHVRRNLEIPDDAPATNHFLANLLGLLAIARTLPELREAHAWGELARSRLIEEIQQQVGADGVSFERSLPYHGFVAELLIHAARIERDAGRPMPKAFLERLAMMLEAIAWSLRPDGTIPAVGDGDDGRVLPLTAGSATTLADQGRLLALGGPLVSRPDLARPAAWTTNCGRRFEDSGWHVMRAGDVHVAVMAGPVGTRGLGNHTHNDLFAPSYWARGREWIVDPGTGSYSRNPALRNWLRGVGAHAALQLGTREPNELKQGRDGLFRVIENAHPKVVAWEATRMRCSLTARHTGYSGPEGTWTWQRRLVLDAASGLLTVHDRLYASEETDVTAAPGEVWLRFPLAPGLAAQPKLQAGSDTRFRVDVRDGVERALHLILDLPPGSEVRIEPCEFSPRYDVVVRSTVIVARLPISRRVEATWSVRTERCGS